MSTETETSKPKNKGGRPRTDVTKTAEFKEAVDAAKQEIIAALAHARSGSVPEGADAGDRELIDRLALSIAEVADQGTGRKRIAPEVIASRKAAYQRMLDIITRNHARGWPNERPLYRVLSQCYFNEQLIQPYTTDPHTKAAIPQLIDWEGCPNEALEPLNEVAKQIYTEYQMFVGGPQGALPGADTRPVIVTPNGLTIRGTGMERRQVGTVQAQGIAPTNEGDKSAPFAHGLAMRGPTDPRAKEIHVLGTIAPPAKQSGVQAP